MCRVLYKQCRFCEEEKIASVDLCAKGRAGYICIDHSFHLGTAHDLIDTTSRYLKAAVALPHSRRKYTCSPCENLTTQVICVVPNSVATVDIDSRPAFSWLCHYYCPGLLDAIYTAARYSLAELQDRLRSGKQLLRWHPMPEDLETGPVDEFDRSPIDGTLDRTMLTHIITTDRTEHHDILLGGGQMGKAMLNQERRERQQLCELILMRQYLRDRLHARQIKEYKVICDPEHSPIEHVRVALIVASTGGTLCGGTRLRDVATRVSVWDRYFDIGFCKEKRKFREPQESYALLWVDRGYGKMHPDRIQEMSNLSRRQQLEQ